MKPRSIESRALCGARRYVRDWERVRSLTDAEKMLMTEAYTDGFLRGRRDEAELLARMKRANAAP